MNALGGFHGAAVRGIAAVATLILVAGRAPAQAPSSNAAEIQELRSELQRIEARLDALESAENAKSATPAAAPAAPPALTQTIAAPPETAAKPGASGPEAVQQAEDKGMDTMDAGMGGEVVKVPIIPALKIRGFGDVRGFLANQNLAVIGNDPGSPTPVTQGGNSTFALGIMDLFVTSQISEKFSYLSEIGFEADPSSNGIGVDLERAQITFMQGPRFSLSAGRTHAMLGYYNTAFHHGTWFQTAIDRPRIFEFEDSGGPLPIHNVGVSAMGALPSGGLGLHWFAEVGNGKQTYSLFAGATPANVLADHTGKSSNIGFYIKPERLGGLRTGFDWYRASLVPVVSELPGYGTPQFAFPNAASYYHQNIYVAHLIYITPTIEFMAEDAEIRDLPRGSTQPLYTSGGYAQVSRLFGESYRPYLRYQWMNPNFNDPNNAWAGRWVGPSAGMRWDINTYIALKAEYSHFDWKNFTEDSSGNQMLPILHKTIEQFGMQLTYTF
jgi:hypothetical protein